MSPEVGIGNILIIIILNYQFHNGHAKCVVLVTNCLIFTRGERYIGPKEGILLQLFVYIIL